jgi:hypothetical protein
MDVICKHDYGLSKGTKLILTFLMQKQKKVENWYDKFLFLNSHSPPPYNTNQLDLIYKLYNGCSLTKEQKIKPDITGLVISL